MSLENIFWPSVFSRISAVQAPVITAPLASKQRKTVERSIELLPALRHLILNKISSCPQGSYEHYELLSESPIKRRIVVIEENPGAALAQEYIGRFATRHVLTSLARSRGGWQLLQQSGLRVPERLRKVMLRVLPENLVELPDLFYGYVELLQRRETTTQQVVAALSIANLGVLADSARYLSMPAVEYAARRSAYQLRDHGVAAVASEYAVQMFHAHLRACSGIDHAVARANALRAKAFACSLAAMSQKLTCATEGKTTNVLVRIDSLYAAAVRECDPALRESRLVSNLEAVKESLRGRKKLREG